MIIQLMIRTRVSSQSESRVGIKLETSNKKLKISSTLPQVPTLPRVPTVGAPAAVSFASYCFDCRAPECEKIGYYLSRSTMIIIQNRPQC